jgi:hypothetical protein
MNREFVPGDHRPLSGLPSVIRVGGIVRLQEIVATLPVRGTPDELNAWSERLRLSLLHLRDLRYEAPLEHHEVQAIIRSALQVAVFRREVYADLRGLFREVLNLCRQSNQAAERDRVKAEEQQRSEGIMRTFRKAGISRLFDIVTRNYRGSPDTVLKEAVHSIRHVPLSQAPDPADALLAEQAIRSLFVRAPEFCETHASALLTVLARLRQPVDQVADLEEEFGRRF